MEEGARRFGWDRRGAPGSRREGEWLVGLGMSASIRSNYLMPARCALGISPDGKTVTVQRDM